MGQNTTSWLRVPVSGASWTVTDLAVNVTIANQANALDNRTRRLPLLYIAHNLTSPETIAAASNKATHVLTFAAPLPPVGFSTFKVQKRANVSAIVPTVALATPSSVSNGMYSIKLNVTSGMIDSVTNIASSATSELNITWGYYESSEGNGEPSGAYIYRPAQQYTKPCGNLSRPTLEVTQGPLVTKIKQVFALWATHIIRLKKGSPYIEVEWTAGPIPKEANPGAKPLPRGACSKTTHSVTVSGAGTAAVNGIYVATNQTREDWPVFKKDAAHQLYKSKDHFGNIWKLAQYGNTSAIYYLAKIAANNGGPPSTNSSWSVESADSPTPSVKCASTFESSAVTGKELVLKFNSALASKETWYADANGREMVQRKRNKRGPSYPPYHVGEPVSGNYYPVNSMISLDDGRTEMAVVSDVSMCGTSMSDGSIEVMVHRRLHKG